jgi:peroxin-13
MNYFSPYSSSNVMFGPQNGNFYPNYRMPPYGMSNQPPMSNFSQLALDESRSAFSSIETVIQTFRSISWMLESTFTSVYSSFRAVTDVFEHFARMRTEISTIYPLVLFWRLIKYLYHRLLRLLRLRQSLPGSSEETWSAIYQSLQSNASPSSNGSTRAASSHLLVALFFLVTFGTPMLMMKILNSIISKRQSACDRVFNMLILFELSFR